jgi:MFS family permease
MRISAAGLRVPPALLGLYLMAFVQMFGAGMLVPIAVIYAKQVVGLEEKAIGTLFLVIVAAVALTTIPAGRMADRVGKRWVVMAGMVLAAAGMWLVPATSRLEGLLAAGVLLGLSYALTFPAWLALVTEMAPPARLGLAVGASETAQGLGLVVGPLLGGFLWDAAGPHAPFVASAAAMTAGAVIAAMVLWRLQWKR